MTELKIGDKAEVIFTKEIVTITGKSADQYRVFINGIGGNKYHTWFPKTNLRKVDG